MKVTLLVSGISVSAFCEDAETQACTEALCRLRNARILSRMGVSPEVYVYRRAVDARKKRDIRFVYTVAVRGDGLPIEATKLPNGVSVCEDTVPLVQMGSHPLAHRPIVVGSGPAGLFASLLLAENGYRPILLERGGSVAERSRAISSFYETRTLDPDTNVQFGAGGAGTFSDGKLVTRISDPYARYVFERFLEFGAPKEIMTLAKPHIGTDLLQGIVRRMLSRIESLGGEVRYHTKLTDIRIHDGAICAVNTTGGELPCDALILAIGHSARDTYEMCLTKPFSIEAKPFSVGMRIEHLQSDIDFGMYGDYAGHPKLSHAEYTLSTHVGGKGVYTFCMCPGGTVMAASSEEGGVVVNGMSYHARDGKNANAAVLVSVTREDYGGTPQGAIAFQRRIEQAAFSVGGSDYAAPTVTVGDFLSGECKEEPKRVLPTYMDGRGVRLALPDHYLPTFVTDSIKAAMPVFGQKIAGYDAHDAVLCGAETRTSAPLRILRGENRMAIGVHGVYPAGEGAGYAGGITSAALDGLRSALALCAYFAPSIHE